MQPSVQPSGCHCNFSRRNESDSKCEDAAGAAWHRWSETAKNNMQDMDGHGWTWNIPDFSIFPFFSKSYSTLQCHMPWHRKSNPFKSTGRSEVLPKLQLENPRGFRQKLWAYGWTNVRNLYDMGHLWIFVYFLTLFHSICTAIWCCLFRGQTPGDIMTCLDLVLDQACYTSSWNSIIWCIQIWQSGTQSRLV